jgi:hypothetical protein
VSGLKVMPTSSNGFNVQSNSNVSDCEVDGANCTASIVGMGVMGENNKILGNYVHDLNYSQSGSTMNNSGGAEGIMVMASNNEVGFNSIVNCQSVNTTLGGFEGGCMEIVNNKGGGQAISNVSFHHNYCDKSVGLWEGCSGDFSSTGGSVLTNHAIIENVTVSYNISVDSMWLFLLQPVNTDFKNVVFANNTIIHTAQSAVYWDSGGGHFSMALAVDSDTSTGTTIKADNQYYVQGSGFPAGTVIVKNNIFVDSISSTRQAMFMTNMVDHSNNLFVPANASVSFAYSGSPALALNSTEQKVDLAALAFTSDYQLAAGSTPAIDKGATVSMSTSASVASAALNAGIFATSFNQDVAKHTVPCGSATDIGASEYCSGSSASLSWPTASSNCGTGGTPSTGGAASVGTGGTPSTGGAASVGTGGTPSTGGVASVGTGGTPSTGGRTSTGGAAPGSAGGLTAAPGTGGSPVATSTGGLAATAGGGSSAALGVGGANAGAPASTGVGTTPGSSTDAGTCSCKVVGRSTQNPLFAVLGSLGMAIMVARRRRPVHPRHFL